MTSDVKPNEMDEKAIREIVRGLDSPDWVQIELLARLDPADRFLAGIQATDFATAALRGTFSQRFPELSLAELNMKVLRYLTTVRMNSNEAT